MAEELPVPAYHNTVYVAPTWDLTTQHPEEIDEAVLRRELAVIKDAFGTGKKHGAYAQL